MRKFYTANIYIDGAVRGSASVWVWFWQSPNDAHKQMHNMIEKGYIADFRRVK